jgi:hypothetical protein
MIQGGVSAFWSVGTTWRSRAKISSKSGRKLSPAQGQRHGIRIAAEPISMRPVRDREHRGCARPLSPGNTHLLHPVPFGDDPIPLSSSRCAARSARVRPTSPLLGDSNMLYFFLGLCWSREDSRTSSIRSILSRLRGHFLAARCSESCRDAL